MRRNPEQLVDVTFMPVLFTVMFGFMFGGAISGGQASYLPILIPGVIAMTTITACVAAGAQLREDMDKGVFDRFRSLPIARSPAGRTDHGRPRPLHHCRRHHRHCERPHGLPPSRRRSRRGRRNGPRVITGWSLAWIFMWIGTAAGTAGAVQCLSMMIMFPLAFLSNAFVPTTTHPAWLQTVTAINPVSDVVSAGASAADPGSNSLILSVREHLEIGHMPQQRRLTGSSVIMADEGSGLQVRLSL